MSRRLRSKSAPSVLIPQYVTADTVIADDDIPDPSALRTFSNASTVIADDNYGYGDESNLEVSEPEFSGEEVPQSDYETMAEREAAENAATKIQSVIRGRNSRKRKGGRKKKSKRKTRKKKRSRKKKNRRKRRKTRRKRRGGAIPAPMAYKRRVDRQEIGNQTELFNLMKRAKMRGDTKEQEKLKKKMKKSFDRMNYWNTPEAKANKERILDSQVKKAMPEIEKSFERGLLVPRKPRSSSTGGKRRRKTKRRKR